MKMSAAVLNGARGVGVALAVVRKGASDGPRLTG